MNYIQKLQEENKQLREQLSNIRQLWIELNNYLLSPKFYVGDRKELGNYVNINDVLLRLNDVGFETIPPTIN